MGWIMPNITTKSPLGKVFASEQKENNTVTLPYPIMIETRHSDKFSDFLKECSDGGHRYLSNKDYYPCFKNIWAPSQALDWTWGFKLYDVENDCPISIAITDDQMKMALDESHSIAIAENTRVTVIADAAECVVATLNKDNQIELSKFRFLTTAEDLSFLNKINTIDNISYIPSKHHLWMLPFHDRRHIACNYETRLVIIDVVNETYFNIAMPEGFFISQFIIDSQNNIRIFLRNELDGMRQASFCMLINIVDFDKGKVNSQKINIENITSEEYVAEAKYISDDTVLLRMAKYETWETLGFSHPIHLTLFKIKPDGTLVKPKDIKGCKSNSAIVTFEDGFFALTNDSCTDVVDTVHEKIYFTHTHDWDYSISKYGARSMHLKNRILFIPHSQDQHSLKVMLQRHLEPDPSKLVMDYMGRNYFIVSDLYLPKSLQACDAQGLVDISAGSPTIYEQVTLTRNNLTHFEKYTPYLKSTKQIIELLNQLLLIFAFSKYFFKDDWQIEMFTNELINLLQNPLVTKHELCKAERKIDDISSGDHRVMFRSIFSNLSEMVNNQNGKHKFDDRSDQLTQAKTNVINAFQSLDSSVLICEIGLWSEQVKNRLPIMYAEIIPDMFKSEVTRLREEFAAFIPEFNAFNERIQAIKTLNYISDDDTVVAKLFNLFENVKSRRGCPETIRKQINSFQEAYAGLTMKNR